MEFEKIIEAILFVSGEAVSIEKIAGVIDISKQKIRIIINSLSEKYENEERGIIIIEIDDSFQMCTNPIYYDYVKTLYTNPEKKSLSQPLMETLAIIAYKQPITRMEIEEIRGVSAVHAVNRLIEHNLVCEKGRLNMPGKPILLGTTDEFLKYFGYRNLDNLPELRDDFENLETEAKNEVKEII